MAVAGRHANASANANFNFVSPPAGLELARMVGTLDPGQWPVKGHKFAKESRLMMRRSMTCRRRFFLGDFGYGPRL
jgi:hypothetical protein